MDNDSLTFGNMKSISSEIKKRATFPWLSKRLSELLAIK